MPRGTEVQRCTPYSNNRWVCSYIVWLPCGCRYDRYTVTLVSEVPGEPPSNDLILKAIAENEDSD